MADQVIDGIVAGRCYPVDRHVASDVPTRHWKKINEDVVNL